MSKNLREKIRVSEESSITYKIQLNIAKTHRHAHEMKRYPKKLLTK